MKVLWGLVAGSCRRGSVWTRKNDFRLCLQYRQLRKRKCSWNQQPCPGVHWKIEFSRLRYISRIPLGIGIRHCWPVGTRSGTPNPTVGTDSVLMMIRGQSSGLQRTVKERRKTPSISGSPRSCPVIAEEPPSMGQTSNQPHPKTNKEMISLLRMNEKSVPSVLKKALQFHLVPEQTTILEPKSVPILMIQSAGRT